MDGGSSTDLALRRRAWLSHAVAFAFVACALKLAINTFASPFRGDLALYAGLSLAVLCDVGFGLVLFAPLLLSRAWLARAAVALLCTLGLLVYSATFHAHAVLRYLPGRASLGFLGNSGPLAASLDAHASWGLLVCECMGGSLAAFALGWWWQRRRNHPRSGTERRVLLIALASVVALIATPLVTRGQLHHGASNPLLHILFEGERVARHPEPAVIEPTANASAQPIAGLMAQVQDVLAVEAPSAPKDPRYPYCRDAPQPRQPSETRHPRSIILLILESVGAREAALVHERRQVMPNLARIAREGVHFSRFYAAGDRSSQGLVGVLSGIPVETHRRILAHAPLVHVPSFPRVLARAGYHTAYLHGSDLSFEQQRSFLRDRLGFDTLVEPTPAEMRSRVGWGLPDGVMYQRLERFIAAQRGARGTEPYFATLFTLSTHDPYTLPPATAKLVEGKSDYERFVNALAYADSELGAFYAWYLEHEKPRGTLLALVGDHVGRVPFPSDPLDTTTDEFEYRFGVPFVLAGLTDTELARARTLNERTGGQLDLPQTLSHLVGLTGNHCFQGRNLLGDSWPKHRYVVSIAGEQLSFFYAHDGRFRFMWQLARNEVRAFDEQDDPLFRRDLMRADFPDFARLSAFLPAYFRLGDYLNLGDHFAPPAQPAPIRAPRPRVEKPLLISHRGNTLGRASHVQENTLAAIDSASAAGFPWVEIDVQITRDGVVVLSHDPFLRSPDGQEHVIAKLALRELRTLAATGTLPTLNEAVKHAGDRVGLCIEVKPQTLIFDSMNLVHAVIAALESLPKGRVIIDSFSRSTLASFAELTPFEVGYDLPQKPVNDAWLDYAVEAGFDWVYVEHPFVTRELVERAHARGLKLMVYTVNEKQKLDALGPELPDGVISDVAAPWGLTPRL